MNVNHGEQSDGKIPTGFKAEPTGFGGMNKSEQQILGPEILLRVSSPLKES